MPQEGEIYLGVDSDEDLISNYVKTVRRSYEKFGKSGRTYSGRFREDVTTKKYTFQVRYEYITAETLALIYEKCGNDEEVNLRMYISDSDFFLNFEGECPVVKLEPFESTDFLTGRPDKIYENVTLTFFEV